MLGQFLFFRRAVHLVLQVSEQPPWRIDFRSVDTKPFRHYDGSWQIERTPTGCRIDYTLNVSRGDMAPRFLEKKLFQENSTSLMRELKAEVGKRAVQDTVLVKATPPPPLAPRL